AHTAHEERGHVQRPELLADDHFRRTATNVDHQAPVGRRRQLVGDAGKDEARFFLAGDDLYRETQRLFEANQHFLRIGCDPQGIGGNGAHAIGMEAFDALAKALERRDRALNGVFVEYVVGVEAGGEANVLLESVDGVDLGRPVEQDDPSYRKPEAVRPQIDSGEKVIHETLFTTELGRL